MTDTPNNRHAAGMWRMTRKTDLETLLTMVKSSEEQPPFAMIKFGAEKVIVSNEAYEMIPIFPDKPRTKRRLRRTRGRFGRTDRMNPLAFKSPYGLIVHPIIYHKLKETL